MCLGCHGAKLEGGKIPGGPPDWPASARLVPGEGNAMARYRDAEVFLRMLKSGKNPDGRALAVMPFEALSKLSDTDARALHLYLTQLGG
jgi:cytochrome c553